ncbi:DUF4251 domain-containing protein [Tenacibaculum adriaticum]|nr:DUF4251 domain-containing protein [Tenacibaculum adriaticum]
MKNILFLFLIIGLLIGCATKKKFTPQELQNFENLVNSKSFKIESNWAQPRATGALMRLQNTGLFPPGSNASMVDISGNANYFTIKNDTVSGYLPYFGERQMGGYPNSSKIGIEFKGVPKEYKVEKTDKGNFTINFSINDSNSRSENYRVTIRLFPNLTSSIYVISSHRTSIEYRGRAKKIDDDNED